MERRRERLCRRDPGVVNAEILLAAVAEVQLTHVFADVRARAEQAVKALVVLLPRKAPVDVDRVEEVLLRLVHEVFRHQ